MKKITFYLYSALSLPTLAWSVDDISPANAIEMFQQHQSKMSKALQEIEPGAAPNRSKQAVAAQPATLYQRDPFALTPLMMQGGETFQSSSAGGNLPIMRLRGLIQQGKRTGMALIEIEGNDVYMLRVGEMVTIRSGQTPLTLRLKRINANSIEVETGSSLQVVIR